MISKPPIFNWYDALTFGAAAVTATGLALVVTLNGRNEGVVWWRWVGLWTVVTGFWGGYILTLLWRKQLRDRIAYITKHGLMIIGDGGTVPFQTQVEIVTEATLNLWREALKKTPRPVATTADAVLNRGVMVFIKPLPFELHTQPGRFAGFAKPHKRAIAVGVSQINKLPSSALAHELGHIILAACIGDPSESTLKEFAQNYGTPY